IILSRKSSALPHGVLTISAALYPGTNCSLTAAPAARNCRTTGTRYPSHSPFAQGPPPDILETPTARRDSYIPGRGLRLGGRRDSAPFQRHARVSSPTRPSDRNL